MLSEYEKYLEDKNRFIMEGLKKFKGFSSDLMMFCIDHISIEHDALLKDYDNWLKDLYEKYSDNKINLIKSTIEHENK